MRLITFPMACYVFMTASAIIIHICTKLQISCYDFFFKKQWSMMRSYFDSPTGGHCWIRWPNCQFSALNRSNKFSVLKRSNKLTVQLQLHGGVDGLSRHNHNIMKNTTVFEGYSLKKNSKIYVSFLIRQQCAKLDNCMYTAINIDYMFPLKIAKRCSPFQINCIDLIWFEYFKTIKILSGQWKIMRATI